MMMMMTEWLGHSEARAVLCERSVWNALRSAQRARKPSCALKLPPPRLSKYGRVTSGHAISLTLIFVQSISSLPEASAQVIRLSGWV